MVSTPARRRVYRFGLRIFFVFVTLSGLCLSWLGGNYQRAKRQQSAIQGLASLPLFFKYEPVVVPESEWLTNAIGKDFCAKITQVVYPSSSVDVVGSRLPNGEMEYLIHDKTTLGGRRYRISSEARDVFRRRRRRDWWIDSYLVHLLSLHDLELLDLKSSRISGLGLNYVGRLVSLRTLVLPGNPLTSAEISHLASLSNLEALDLTGTGIDDKGLLALRGLKELRSLQLDRARLTDDGLRTLQAFGNLQEISLCGVKRVTDKGMASVKKLTHLTSLNVYGTQLTHEGLESLNGLIELKALNLSFTKIDNQALSRLATLRNLETLQLANTNVDDRGLRYLGDLPNLESLDLSYCQVTDIGLRELVRVPNLKSLILERTSVTSDGIREFCKLKPSCEVRRLVFH